MKCENCGNEHDGSYGSGRFCSEHCKASFLGKKTGGKKGRVPWNKGLTSETDQRVKKRGEFLSKRYCNGELVQHNKGKHLSPEHRKLISEKRKLYLKEHPEKVPYVLNHSSKESFPERFFREAFTNEGFPKFIQDKYVNGYFLDFAFEGLNKYIEVDGEPAEGYAVGDMQAKPNLITVEGPKNLLNSLKEFLVVVDVEGASDTVEVSAVPELYDSEGERVTSKQLTYDVSTVDASVEIWKTKTVDLELAYEGEPAKGYELVSFDYEPKQLTVTASEDILEDLEKITLPSISIEGRIENYEKDIEITRDLLPEGVENADPDAKDVKAQATIEEIKSQTIPFTSGSITVRGNDQNYNIAYDAGNDYELVVYCTDSRKKKLTILDFAPWIDVTDLGAGTHTLRVRVKDVEGVTVEKTPKISIMLTEK